MMYTESLIWNVILLCSIKSTSLSYKTNRKSVEQHEFPFVHCYMRPQNSRGGGGQVSKVQKGS